MDDGSHTMLEQLSEMRTFTADDVLAFAHATGASAVHSRAGRVRPLDLPLARALR
jgi:hypothetical protein